MHRRSASLILFLVTAVALLSVGASSAAAADFVWTGAGLNGNWSNPANWTGNAAPESGDDLFFPNSPMRSETVNDYSATTRFNSITISSGEYSFEGNPVTLTYGITADQVAGTVTFSPNVDMPSGGWLTAVSSSGTLALSGTVSGTLLFRKSGAGDLRLDGTNTFGANLEIQAGRVVITSDGALGGVGGRTTITSGTQLTLAGARSIAEPIVVSGAASDTRAISTTGPSATLTGQVRIERDTYVGVNGGTLVLAGIVTDNTLATNASISKVGAGSLELTNALNDLTAATTLVAREGDVTVAAAAPLGRAGLRAAGGSFVLSGGITLTNPMGISGSGAGAAGAIRSSSGDNVCSGTITLEDDADIGVTDGSLTVSTLADSVPHGLGKVGAGTLVVAGSPAYSGVLDVDGGTLQVDGTLPAAGHVTVHAGAALDGSGTAGHVTVLSVGSYSPGHSPGLLTLAGLTLADGATFSEELNGTTAGTGYDQTVVAGAVDLGGGILSVSIGFTPAGGDVFTIVRNDGLLPVTGTFLGLPEGARVSVGSSSLVLSYAGGDGNDVTLTDVPVITASAGAHGSIDPSGEVIVAVGADQTFTVTAQQGYQIADVLVDDVSEGPLGSYTFEDVDADHTIAASFKLADQTVIAPSAGSLWQEGSLQTVAWTTDPAVSTGEFRVWLVSAGGAWYVGKQVLPTAGRTSYSTSVRAAVPAGSYRAAVYWRPATGSGDWVLTAKSASFTVAPIDVTVSAPAAGEVWQAQSPGSAAWEVDPELTTGEFRLSLVSQTTGTWYVNKLVPAAAGKTSYATSLNAAVPPGSYKLAVYWRASPTSAWDATQKSAAFTVASLAISSPTALSSWPRLTSQSVEWSVTPGLAAGEFRVWLINQTSGAWSIGKSVAVVKDQTAYETDVSVSVAAGSYKAAVYWRPDAASPWTLAQKGAAFTVTP